jgi:pyrophosphatase PpaX
VRSVLFDLDGTLVDTIELIRRSFHQAFDVLGMTRPPDAVFVDTIGLPLRTQFAQVTSDAGQIDRLIEAYRDYYIQHHNDLIEVYDGIQELLDAIASRGLALGVVTSKIQRGAQRTLGAAGLASRFQVVIGADDVGNPKPHPEPVQRALEQLDMPPDEACLVGDSIYDMQAGRAAGVHTVAALWGPGSRETLEPSRPGTWADTPGTILDIL